VFLGDKGVAVVYINIYNFTCVFFLSESERERDREREKEREREREIAREREGQSTNQTKPRST
jgi:hypothetical protein